MRKDIFEVVFMEKRMMEKLILPKLRDNMGAILELLKDILMSGTKILLLEKAES